MSNDPPARAHRLSSTQGQTLPAKQGAEPVTTGLSDAFVVHEWGTFTSLQDHTGACITGMHHDDAPLPPFVYFEGYVPGRRGGDPLTPKDSAPNKATGADLTPAFPLSEPTQRMETPVIYVHSAQARAVTVRVNFPFGLITQWFPDVAALTPQGPVVADIAGGSAVWQVQVDPQLDASLAPPVSADNIWAPSRQVQVPALRAVTVRQSRGATQPEVEQVEKFIFYRGVADLRRRSRCRAKATACCGCSIGRHSPWRRRFCCTSWMPTTADLPRSVP